MARWVLVTGATGLVGNNVVRALIERGDRVRAMVRHTSDPRPLAGLDVQTVPGDVRDAESVRRACEGADCLVHAAAYVQLGRSMFDLHRAVNVQGTQNAARAARAAGIRMVHVSTVDALGFGSPDQPADEQAPPGPYVPCNYVLTKRQAEQRAGGGQLPQPGRGLHDSRHPDTPAPATPYGPAGSLL